MGYSSSEEVAKSNVDPDGALNMVADNDSGPPPSYLPRGVVRWWWVRHAPVYTGDRPGLIVGQLDLSCDTSDRDSFDILADRLPTGACLLTSPLLRTRQTVMALERSGIVTSPAESVEAFMEQSFGAWEGDNWNELGARTQPDNDADYASFWGNPACVAPPQGESFASLMERVHGCVTYWTQKVGCGDIIAVAHAGTIRAAIAQALDLSPAVALRLGVDPLSLTCLDHHEVGGWSVRCVNETVP